MIPILYLLNFGSIRQWHITEVKSVAIAVPIDIKLYLTPDIPFSRLSLKTKYFPWGFEESPKGMTKKFHGSTVKKKEKKEKWQQVCKRKITESW